MSFLKFALVFANRFLTMHVALSLDLVVLHPPLSSTGSMVSKRLGLKDTGGSTTREAVERVSTSLLIYEDTKLIVDKDIKLKWKEVNDVFASTLGEDLGDH